jgi:hypothetical protein
MRVGLGHLRVLRTGETIYFVMMVMMMMMNRGNNSNHINNIERKVIRMTNLCTHAVHECDEYDRERSFMWILHELRKRHRMEISILIWIKIPNLPKGSEGGSLVTLFSPWTCMGKFYQKYCIIRKRVCITGVANVCSNREISRSKKKGWRKNRMRETSFRCLNSSWDQYSETNVMHFLFSLSIIKGLYMFRALLAHPQEALHELHLVYCVRVMSVGCTRVGVERSMLVSLYWYTMMHGKQNIKFKHSWDVYESEIKMVPNFHRSEFERNVCHWVPDLL